MTDKPAESAVERYEHEHEVVCDMCGGLQDVKTADGWVQCEWCNGTGLVYAEVSVVARLADAAITELKAERDAAIGSSVSTLSAERDFAFDVLAALREEHYPVEEFANDIVEGPVDWHIFIRHLTDALDRRREMED